MFSDIVDENGWLKTGDLIDILVNGSIKISGRLKDIIKV
jgi:long-subunit acyl-CoA synthetase (AMP-forming)